MLTIFSGGRGAWLHAAAAALAIIASACGGDVVVPAEATTATSQPACSCDEVCQNLDSCEWYHGSFCVSFCEALTPEQHACLCSIGDHCNDIFGCSKQ